jgi:NAD(P)-dependent dehydrogenase (short-subunit alcohol dehydrogenase family)
VHTKVAVVTGASAGIGRAVVRELSCRGASIGLVARGDAGLDATAREVAEAGGRALAIPTDVAEPGQVEQAAQAVEAELGPIDLWVNDAFSSVFAPFLEIDPDEFRRVTEVSYLGFVYGTRAALALMVPRNRGTIVQVGSALAYRGIPLQSAYCGAKHAIQGFTESVRCELRHRGSGVRITMVQLPAVNTPQFTWVLSRLPHHPQPVPPIYQPEVAARAIAWAAEHDRREWWVGASTAATLIANAVAPGLLERYLSRTGYTSQQTGEAADPNRPANLWKPLDSETDYGAHGEFDRRAHPRSAQWWATTHRAALAGAVGGLAVAATAASRLVRGRPSSGKGGAP